MNRGRCPVCGKPPLESLRPFCSPRCADVDLNRWLTGGYSITDDDEENAPDRTTDDPDSDL